jgi:hypothetical protein
MNGALFFVLFGYGIPARVPMCEALPDTINL